MRLYGWVIYSGFLQSEKFIDFAHMLRDAGVEHGHEVDVFTNGEIVNIITNHWDVRMPDYVLFTDKDIYLASQLEKLGIRVFNRAHTIEVSDDKIKTYQQLALVNVPIPKTIVAPKTYIGSTAFSQDYLDGVVTTFGYPFIIKEAFGSFGEQVYLIKDKADFQEQLETVKEPFMFQEFITTSYGEDIRVQVVGDEVVAAMKRRSESDFRANITSGGSMEPYEPTEKEKALAIAASRAIGADFSGVDLLLGENDQPIVCEVNSNGHIRNLLDCTGINAAYPIVAYVEKELEKR